MLGLGAVPWQTSCSCHSWGSNRRSLAGVGEAELTKSENAREGGEERWGAALLCHFQELLTSRPMRPTFVHLSVLTVGDVRAHLHKFYSARRHVLLWPVIQTQVAVSARCEGRAGGGVGGDEGWGEEE